MAVDSGPRSSALLPAIAPVRGPLAIRVVYPTPGDRVDAGDSSFMFGSVGSGDAALTINGQPVQVWPNGAWLAWIAFPPDSLMRFEMVATRGAENVTRSTKLVESDARCRAKHSGSTRCRFHPRGRSGGRRASICRSRFGLRKAPPSRSSLPDGNRVPLVTDPNYDEVAWGIRAFDRDTTNLVGSVRADRYIGSVRGVGLGPDPGPVLRFAARISSVRPRFAADDRGDSRQSTRPGLPGPSACGCSIRCRC